MAASFRCVDGADYQSLIASIWDVNVFSWPMATSGKVTAVGADWALFALRTRAFSDFLAVAIQKQIGTRARLDFLGTSVDRLLRLTIIDAVILSFLAEED